MAQLRTETTPTRLAFGSCNKQFKPQPFWKTIASHNPDAWIWLGDIMYADKPVFLKLRIPAGAKEIEEAYAMQMRNPDYAAFTQQVPTVGVWDDHDFGKNDGSKHVDATLKNQSLQLLLDFLGEPSSSPRRSQSGAWASYTFGSHPRQVRVILLDNRSNRDEYDLPHAQDMLGDAQWEWLAEQLGVPGGAWGDGDSDSDSDATGGAAGIEDRDQPDPDLVFIGAGLQIISRGDPWVAESWSRLPASQAKLYSMIALSRGAAAPAATGAGSSKRRSSSKGRVVLLSGDVHMAELNRLQCPSLGFPLYDLTSSGMTHSWGGPVRSTAVWLAMMNTHLAPGTTRYTGKNWGELDLQWTPASASDADADAGVVPIVRLKVWGEDDQLAIDYTLTPELLTPTAAAAGGAGGAGGALDPALMAATEACAHTRLDRGFPPACAAFMASCTPQITAADSAAYFAKHAVIVCIALTAVLTALAAPVVAWRFGGRVKLPGGRGTVWAVVVLTYAAVWAFIESLH